MGIHNWDTYSSRPPVITMRMLVFHYLGNIIKIMLFVLHFSPISFRRILQRTTELRNTNGPAGLRVPGSVILHRILHKSRNANTTAVSMRTAVKPGYSRTQAHPLGFGAGDSFFRYASIRDANSAHPP